MKKFRFLLLDAGPIIKLFELGVWDQFTARCEVTVCRTVVAEAKWASQEFTDIRIDLDSDECNARIRVQDVELATAKEFHNRFDPSYRTIIHDGEKETLAFLCHSPEEWLVCSADSGVFRTLGALGRANQGISLEEILTQLGLGRSVEWKYSKRFRLKYTCLGQEDAIQGQGLL